jgi:hypothetical protein
MRLYDRVRVRKRKRDWTWMGDLLQRNYLFSNGGEQSRKGPNAGQAAKGKRLEVCASTRPFRLVRLLTACFAACCRFTPTTPPRQGWPCFRLATKRTSTHTTCVLCALVRINASVREVQLGARGPARCERSSSVDVRVYLPCNLPAGSEGARFVRRLREGGEGSKSDEARPRDGDTPVDFDGDGMTERKKKRVAGVDALWGSTGQ